MKITNKARRRLRMKFSLKLLTALMTTILVLCIVTSLFVTADVSQFADFPTGSWSEPALKAGVDNGLIQGKGDGRIAPKDYITRAETAAIINRCHGKSRHIAVYRCRSVHVVLCRNAKGGKYADCSGCKLHRASA